jgi:DNA polymerase-3 subunit delta
VPQVRPEALETALKRGLAPLVWIHGDEPLLVQEAADAVRATARAQGLPSRHVFEVDRWFKPSALQAQTNSLSLFDDGKLIELRFSGKPPKELGQALAESVAQLDASVRLLAISARLDRSVTDSAWFGTLERGGLVVPVYPVERRQLPSWIAERLARQNQRADSATLELIAERVEGNLLAAWQEVRKLALLFGPGELPAQETRAAVLSVARYDAFGLVEAALTGDGSRAMRSLEGLRAEGEAPPLILWALGDAVRTLLRLHEARAAGRPLTQALREARVFGPRERLFEGALKRLAPAVCAQALQRAAQTDRIAKGVAAGDTWGALESLAMLLAGVSPPKEI